MVITIQITTNTYKNKRVLVKKIQKKKRVNLFQLFTAKKQSNHRQMKSICITPLINFSKQQKITNKLKKKI